MKTNARRDNIITAILLIKLVVLLALMTMVFTGCTTTEQVPYQYRYAPLDPAFVRAASTPIYSSGPSGWYSFGLGGGDSMGFFF